MRYPTDINSCVDMLMPVSMKYLPLAIILGLCWSCATAPPVWTPETVAVPSPAREGIEPAAPLDERAEEILPAGQTMAETPVPLSRDGALLTAISNNRSLEVARFGPEIAGTFVPEARAAFDPTLLGTLSTGRTREPLPVRRLSSTSRTSSSSRSSSGSTGTTGTSSGMTPSGAMTQAQRVQQNIAQAQRVLDDLDSASTLYENRKNPFVETRSTDGTVLLQETLPTGTQLFLTGAASRNEVARSVDNNAGSWVVGASQPLLRGAGLDVNLVELKQAKNVRAQSEHVLRVEVTDLVRQVEDAYWELVLANEVLKIRDFAVSLADEQLRRNQDLYSVGKTVEGDVMSAKAERSSRIADRADAQAAIETETLALIRFLNPDVEAPWKIQFHPVDPPEVEHIDVNPDVSERLANIYRSELAESRLEVANSDLGLIQTRNGLLPRLDLVGSYGRSSSGFRAGDITRKLDSPQYDSFQFGLEFETPILYRAERARNQRAKMVQSQASANLSDFEQAVATEVRQAAVEVGRQWKRIDATQDAVTSRKEELRIAEDRNAVGKTTNLDLQIVQRDLIQAEVDEVTARIHYIEALTGLYAAEGTLLERRGIRLQGDTLYSGAQNIPGDGENEQRGSE